MLQLKPSQVEELLMVTIPARLPVLIVGGPGVGKTSVVRKVAARLDADLLLSTPSTEDPTEPKGFPWAEKGKADASFKAFGNRAAAKRATKTTVWFLDDLGQALPGVQSGYMPLLQGRTADGEKLPECVVFVAATNRRSDRAGVGGLLEPVKSRFAMIVEMVPDLDEVVQWMLEQDGISPEVPAYLRWQPDALNQFKASADLENSPVPRTWEHAGRILALKIPNKAVESAAICGAVGDGQGGQLLAFVEMFRQLPSVDGILLDPDSAIIPKQVSVLYAVSTAVASRVTEKNFGRAARYAARLEDEGHGDFAALLIRDTIRRKPTLQQTPEFVKLMSSPLGQLMGGGN